MVLIRMIKKFGPVWLLIIFGLFNPYQPDANAKELKVGFIYLSSAKDAGGKVPLSVEIEQCLTPL
jgi:hypothetical protein